MSAPHPIERMVHFLSFVHGTSRSLATGKMTTGDVVRATVLTPRAFPSFLAFTMATSGLLGYLSTNYILDQKSEAQRRLLDKYYEEHQPRGRPAMVIPLVQSMGNPYGTEDHLMLEPAKGQEASAVAKPTGEQSEEFRRRLLESPRPYLGE